MLSRITGFVRMWATALALGANSLAASYSVANNMPNMIYELVAGGILSALFVPTYMQVRAEKGDEDAWRFASHAFNIVVLVLGAVALLGTFLPQPFVWTQTFRNGATESAAVRESATFFFRFFAIQIVAYGAGAVIQGVLNARREYLWPALGPVFNNVVVIATMLFVASRPLDRLSLTVLAVGTTLGVVAMFGVMIPTLVRTGARHVLQLGLSDPAVRRMLRLAVPTVLYVVTNLIAVSFRNASAFAVAENGPSVLLYAWTFYQLPYGVLGVALATAFFTEMSDAASRDDRVAFRAHYLSGLRVTTAFMLPATALLIALATPLSTLYLVGRFEVAQVSDVASALRVWALGLTFFACMMFTLRAFYSLKDTRTPMIANAGATVFQITGYLVLTTGIAGWPGLGLEGIPLSDAIFSALLLSVLVAFLGKRSGGLDLRELGATVLRMGAASIAGGTVAWLLSSTVMPTASDPLRAALAIVIGGTAGGVTMYAIGRLLHAQEVRRIDLLIAHLRQRLLGR